MHRPTHVATKLAIVAGLVATASVAPTFGASSPEPLVSASRAQGGAADYRSELVRARKLLASGRAKDSIEVFEAANKLVGKKSAECFLGLSLAHLRIGKFKDAHKHAQKAVEYAKTSHEQAEGRYFMGTALMGLDKGDGKKIAEGVPELRQAIEIEPENSTYRYQLGVALLRLRDDDAGIQQLERFLELAPDSSEADKVRGFIEYPLRAHPDYAPEFEIVTASGRKVSLVNQRGRVLLLDFWATWCPPCVESVPWLKRLHQEFSDDPFTLLGVSLDQDEADWTTFVQEKEMSWEQYYDGENRITPEFLPPEFAIPTYVVIDGRGLIRGVFIGDDRTSLRRLEATVEDCLEELGPVK